MTLGKSLNLSVPWFLVYKMMIILSLSALAFQNIICLGQQLFPGVHV